MLLVEATLVVILQLMLPPSKAVISVEEMPRRLTALVLDVRIQSLESLPLFFSLFHRLLVPYRKSLE